MIFPLRRMCSYCGSLEGRIETRNGQDCVYCCDCNRFQYNAPKTETGRKERTVSTVHEGITTGQRARILERATGRCELCGAKTNLHIGHLLSVVDGMKEGLTEQVLNSDENLAAMCDACNLGMGRKTVSLRLATAILKAREENP